MQSNLADLARCLALWTPAVFCLIPLYTAGMIVGLFSKNRGLRLINIWNRLFLALFQVEVRIDAQRTQPLPARKALFVLLNQTSLLEAHVMMLPLPLQRVIVNIEYAFIPLIGWSHWIFGWVIVRQWPQQAIRTMHRAQRFLEKDGSIWMSIEGRRSVDGELSPYKKGPVILAIQSQAEIVPFFIHGCRECLPYGEWRIRHGLVRIKFLESISTQGLMYDDRDKRSPPVASARRAGNGFGSLGGREIAQGFCTLQCFPLADNATSIQQILPASEL